MVGDNLNSTITIIVAIAFLCAFIAVVSWLTIFPPKFIFKGYRYKNWERNQKGMSKEQARQKYKRMSRIAGLVNLALWFIFAVSLFCKMID